MYSSPTKSQVLARIPLLYDHSMINYVFTLKCEGFIGFFTFSTQWILLPILSASGWEPFELPSDSRTWLLVFFNALLSFTYNVFFMLSIALAGPVLSSVGVTLYLRSWAFDCCFIC
jgi:hypothetical protein